MSAQLELFDDIEQVCPWCGEEIDFTRGLDLVGNFIDWVPCCEGMRDAVGSHGWAEVFGTELADDIAEIAGEAPRSIEDDYLALFPLSILDPTTAHRDGRCESPKGWRSRVFDAVDRHHRHHGRPTSYKFGVEVYNGATRVGVAVVGRPVSRLLQQAEPCTLEVTRVTTWGDGRLRRNASSKLYAACATTARKAGATKLITYTLESENGSSLKASGFTPVATTKGGSWNRPARGRADNAPTCRKVRWERKIA